MERLTQLKQLNHLNLLPSCCMSVRTEIRGPSFSCKIWKARKVSDMEWRWSSDVLSLSPNVQTSLAKINCHMSSNLSTSSTWASCLRLSSTPLSPETREDQQHPAKRHADSRRNGETGNTSGAERQKRFHLSITLTRQLLRWCLHRTLAT